MACRETLEERLAATPVHPEVRALIRKRIEADFMGAA